MKKEGNISILYSCKRNSNELEYLQVASIKITEKLISMSVLRKNKGETKNNPMPNVRSF